MNYKVFCKKLNKKYVYTTIQIKWVFIVDYIKRTSVVDVFHRGTGLWYVGTVARVHDGEDGDHVLSMHYPHHESEQLVWKKGMYTVHK